MRCGARCRLRHHESLTRLRLPLFISLFNRSSYISLIRLPYGKYPHFPTGSTALPYGKYLASLWEVPVALQNVLGDIPERLLALDPASLFQLPDRLGDRLWRPSSALLDCLVGRKRFARLAVGVPAQQDEQPARLIREIASRVDELIGDRAE